MRCHGTRQGKKTGSDAATAREGGDEGAHEEGLAFVFAFLQRACDGSGAQEPKNNPHGFCDMRIFLTHMEA